MKDEGREERNESLLPLGFIRTLSAIAESHSIIFMVRLRLRRSSALGM